ncbi:MAG: orotate phosphoribosyltransferase [Desulfobacteraceae bacterium]
MDHKKKRLLHLLREKSYHHRADPPFTLASGRKSPYYIDCKPTMHHPEGKALIAEIIFNRIKGLNIDAIGGLTMGADPIAIATSLLSYLRGRPIKSFSVRKTPKGRGTEKTIEGDICPGDKVIIVDDVITSGASVITAVRAAENFGLKIIKVIVLVDREEGGREAIEKRVPKVEAIFTLRDLKELDTVEGDSPKGVVSRPVKPAYSAM